MVECAGPETGPVNEFASAMAVALEAQRLVELRDRWLNPPEWVDETEIPLSANGQAAQFIHEMFPGTDTSDFVGSVRCTVSGGGRFTGVALEMDANNRIFTTLPVVPIPR